MFVLKCSECGQEWVGRDERSAEVLAERRPCDCKRTIESMSDEELEARIWLKHTGAILDTRWVLLKDDKDSHWGYDVVIYHFKYRSMAEAVAGVKVLRTKGFMIDTAYPASDFSISAARRKDRSPWKQK